MHTQKSTVWSYGRAISYSLSRSPCPRLVQHLLTVKRYIQTSMPSSGDVMFCILHTNTVQFYAKIECNEPFIIYRLCDAQDRDGEPQHIIYM